MIFYLKVFLILVPVVFIISITQGAEILCLVGTAKHNKPEWTQPLFKKLAEHHHLTIISTAHYLKQELIPNVSHVQLENSYDVVNKHYKEATTGSYKAMWPIKHMLVWHEAKLSTCKDLMASSGFREAIRITQNKYFHLIIYDATYGVDCLISSIHKPLHNVPILGLSEGKMNMDVVDLMHAYDTLNPALVPHFTSDYPFTMNYWQRLKNHILYSAEELLKAFIVRPQLHSILPLNSAAQSDSIRNKMKLLLLNTHPSLDYIQNMPPNIIGVGGLHISAPTADALPKEVHDFAARYKNGIIYISLPYIDLLGSSGLDEILSVIEQMNDYGFLSSTSIEHPKLPKNLLLLEKGFRQQDILALQDLMVFVTHADSFSVQEAIHSGTPILALPLILDQFNNAKRIEERNIGIVLDTTDSLQNKIGPALKFMIENEEFYDSFHQSKLNYQNRMVQPLDEAVWYAEELLRDPNVFDYLALGKDNGQQNYFVLHSLDVLILPLLVIVIYCLNVYIIVNRMSKGKKDKVLSSPENTKKKPKDANDKQQKSDRKKLKQRKND